MGVSIVSMGIFWGTIMGTSMAKEYYGNKLYY